jgi:hypothetical protein
MAHESYETIERDIKLITCILTGLQASLLGYMHT